MNETPYTETAGMAADVLWPSLHSPQWLWLLPLVLVAFALLRLLARRGRQRALSTFAAPRLLGSLLGSLSTTRRAFKAALILIGAVLIVLAVCRPQYGFRWSESRSRGIDIVFVLDTSRSMLATDIKPDRLQRAKLAIIDFVEELQGDRIGLVAFAGDAFLQCPLTLDYRVFEQSLEAINTDTIPVGGTDFAKAITVAEDAFAKDNNHKILIMLTDGEDLEGDGLKRAREAAQKGVTIFTVGVGTAEGSLIPVTDRFGRRDYLRDANGQQVLTRLESDTLNDIAQVTGGFYVPLGATGQGLQTVYHDGLQAFEKQELSSQMKREGIDRFQWPLGLAIILLAWEPLVSNRRANARRALNLFRRSKPADSGAALQTKATGNSKNAGLAADSANAPKGTLPLLASLLLPAALVLTALSPSAAEGSLRSAESLFNKGDLPAAEDAFNQLLEADPANSRARYNLANTQLAQKQYEQAAQTYAQVLATADIALQADAFYNLGLSHYGRGAQVFEGSDPAQTQAQSVQALAVATQAMQGGRQLLAEAARLQELDAREPAQGVAGSPPAGQQPQAQQQPEIQQEAVQQAIQLAEQAKSANETAREDGQHFIEKAQAASGFWRRAAADFNSAAGLSAGNVADARYNAEQMQKSVDALSARISQTQRADVTHGANVESLDTLIEELKKLLKEPPQNDQNQDQQNQQDNQQNQDNQQQQDQSQQGQSGEQNQSDSQQNQQNDQQQNQGQSGEQQQNQNSEQQNQQQDQQQGGEQNQQQNEQQQDGKSGEENRPEQQQQDGEPRKENENTDGQKPEQNERGDNSERPQDTQNDSGKDNQSERPQDGRQDERGTDDQQQQQSAGQREQSANAEDRGASESGETQQPVDLTDEQAQQLAAGEQPPQDQPAAVPQEGAAQRAGAMSQQEAAGLLDSLNNSGRLLPLSGRGQQTQSNRPSRDW